MRTIIKGAALLAALTMLMRKRKGGKAGTVRNESRGQGLWRKSAPNPDSYDKYGDIG